MINILGLLHHADASESRPPILAFDVEFLRRQAQTYEQSGFDRVLIGQHARAPDSLAIASYVASCTRTLKFMVAHRPGFVAPTMAARMFATLDRLAPGRVAAHIISAASDVETQCDGDFLTKDQRYARSSEYVEILRRIWASDTPLDHDGAFYSFRGALCDARPQAGAIPIFWGGASAEGIAFGARCADVYAMGGGSLERTRDLLEAVRSQAAALGRQPEFCMSMRVILGETEGEAWQRAYAIRDAIVTFQAAGGSVGRDKGAADRRAVQEAEAAARTPDPCLWTGLTTAIHGRAHITALVGTPARLQAALLRYHDAGITNFILTGFDSIPDTIAIGKTLIPGLKAAAASRHAATAS